MLLGDGCLCTGHSDDNDVDTMERERVDLISVVVAIKA